LNYTAIQINHLNHEILKQTQQTTITIVKQWGLGFVFTFLHLLQQEEEMRAGVAGGRAGGVRSAGQRRRKETSPVLAMQWLKNRAPE